MRGSSTVTERNGKIKLTLSIEVLRLPTKINDTGFQNFVFLSKRITKFNLLQLIYNGSDNITTVTTIII